MMRPTTVPMSVLTTIERPYVQLKGYKTAYATISQSNTVDKSTNGNTSIQVFRKLFRRAV